MSVSVMHGRLMICEEYVSVTQGSPCQCDADSTICDVCQNDARMPVQLYSMWRGKSVWCKEANITMYVKTVCQRNARKARYNRVFQRNARKARCNCVWRLSIKMYGSLLCEDCISAWRMENYMIFCEDMSARCREDCTIIICEDCMSVWCKEDNVTVRCKSVWCKEDYRTVRFTSAFHLPC